MEYEGTITNYDKASGLGVISLETTADGREDARPFVMPKAGFNVGDYVRLCINERGQAIHFEKGE